MSAPLGSSWILLGAATNPLSLRRQVEQPDMSCCTPAPKFSQFWEVLPPAPCIAGTLSLDGLGISTPGYQHSDSQSQLPKLLQVQQNCLPGSSALGCLRFPVPTQPNTAGHIHNHFSPTPGFMLPAAKPVMTASLPLGP